MKRLPFLGAALFVLLSLFPLLGLGREWTDDAGLFHIEAELVTVRGGKAYLEKDGGKIIGVPLARLSEKDLRYLVSLPEHEEYFKANPLPKIAPAGSSTASRPSKKPKVATIQVDDASKVGEIRRFGDLRWGVTSLGFSPDGRFLAVGKMDQALMVFDVNKSQRVAFLEKLDGLGQVTSVAFSPDGSKLLAGGYTGRIQVWSVGSDGSLTEANRFVGHVKAVHSMAVSKDGTRVLSGGDGKIARCWTLADAQEQFAIDGFAGSIKATFITRGGKQGLACDGDTIALIDIKTGKAIQTMQLGRRSSQTVAIAPDGSRVVVNNTYAIQSWKIKSGKGDPVFQDREIQWFATFLPNSRYLLSGGRGKVNLWEVDKQRKIYEFDTAGTGYVKSIAVSPDNRHFAAIPGSAGQELQVFRMPAKVAK